MNHVYAIRVALWQISAGCKKGLKCIALKKNLCCNKTCTCVKNLFENSDSWKWISCSCSYWCWEDWGAQIRRAHSFKMYANSQFLTILMSHREQQIFLAILRFFLSALFLGRKWKMHDLLIGTFQHTITQPLTLIEKMGISMITMNLLDKHVSDIWWKQNYTSLGFKKLQIFLWKYLIFSRSILANFLLHHFNFPLQQLRLINRAFKFFEPNIIYTTITSPKIIASCARLRADILQHNHGRKYKKKGSNITSTHTMAILSQSETQSRPLLKYL